MFFSIIIPVFNVENYLCECIDSILSQTFKSFEIILIDDGSMDSSGDICDEYAHKDERIVVIHKENGGQSSARNVGTKIAKGDYIIYIDSDDYILSVEFLEILSQKCKGFDLVFYKHQKLDDESKLLSDCTYSYSNIDQTSSYTNILKEMIKCDAFFGMPWNKCIKHDIIKYNHIQFEEGLTGEDMDWIYYIIIHSASITLVNESFIAYRQRKNSVTSTVKIKNLIDYLSILEKWYNISKDNSLSQDQKEVLLTSLAKYYAYYVYKS